MFNLFSKKRPVTINDFCTEFYENQILNPLNGKLDANKAFAEVIIKEISEVDSSFSKIETHELIKELVCLRLELFSLVWTHKFHDGKRVISQEIFTRNFLHSKNLDNLWKNMEPYNNIIDGAVLNWLTGLGKMNMSFNYRMREDLSKENIKQAQTLGVKSDDITERVNHRLLSENAWNQKLILGPLVYTLCNRLGIDAKALKGEAKYRLEAIMFGLYQGAQQSFDNVSIID